MAQPKVGGLLGARVPPSARLLRRPRPDRGALPGPLSLLCLCLAAGFLFLLLISSRMDSVMSRSNKGGRRMTVRMGSDRHISSDSAVMPLPDALPTDLASAAAILGHGPRFRGSAKMETGGGHLGGLSLPKQEPTEDAANRDSNKGYVALEALKREGPDTLVDQQLAADQIQNRIQSQPDIHTSDGRSAAVTLVGKLPEVMPAEPHGKDTKSDIKSAAGAGGKRGGSKKITTPQELLAQGLIEAKNKRSAQEQLKLQARKQPKNLVHDSSDARDSLLSSMGVSKEGRISEKPPSRGTETSAGDSAANSESSTGSGGGGGGDGAVVGGTLTAAGESAAGSADDSSAGATVALVAVADGGDLGEDQEEDEWDFDRKAQALQAQLFDLKGLMPGALRPLPDRPPRSPGGSRGKQQRLTAENRARTLSGECQQLLAKAIEGDKQREVRQREEELSKLVNIWDPEEEKKARESVHYRTRADHGDGKPAPFPPGTEGMLGRQYTEDRERAQKMMELTWDLYNATWHAGMSTKDIAEMWLKVVSPEAAVIIRGFLEEANTQGQEAEGSGVSRGQAGHAALDGPKPLSISPESVTEQAKALEGMLQEMCGGNEKCMLEAWRLCKEQPKCVHHVYLEHMADRSAAKGTQEQTDKQQATPPIMRPGAAAAAAAAADQSQEGVLAIASAALQPGESEAAKALEQVCGGRLECIQQIRLMCGQRPACIMGVVGEVTQSISGGSTTTQLGAGGTNEGIASGLNPLPLTNGETGSSSSH